MFNLQYNLDFYKHYYTQKKWSSIIWHGLQYRNYYFKYFVRRYLKKPKGKKIFDYSFGNGTLLSTFPTENHIYGSEIVDESISIANTAFIKYQSANFVKVSPEKKNTTEKLTPFQDNSFDLSICSHVLEHVTDDTLVIQELARVTNIDQHVIMVIPINETLHEDPRHLRTYTSNSFIQQVKDCTPLKLVAFEEYHSNHIFDLESIWTYAKRKGKITLPTKIASITINTSLCLIPSPIIRKIDHHLINKHPSKKPHELITLWKKQ